jgi:UDP-N-acetylmuramate dehydrogenase
LGKGVIISLRLRLLRVETPVLNRIRELNRRRRKSQPLELPTAGSTFKNPKGDFAGRLLEEVGLKGFCTEGGLCFSEKHANFMVNTEGRATFEDALRLMEEAKERVFKTFGVELKEEVKLLGSP